MTPPASDVSDATTDAADQRDLPRCTAFAGHRRLAAGDLSSVALAVRHARDAGATEPLLVIDDATGGVIDLDLRGRDADIVARIAGDAATSPTTETRRRGRPSMGVVGR